MQELVSLLKRAYRSYIVVGIYCTGEISKQISLCYDYLSDELSAEDLIVLTIDTELTDNRLDIAAYSPPTIVEFNNVVLQTRYERMPVEIYATDADKIARMSTPLF